MKAEERKENETNALRVWVEHTKERMQGRSAYLIGGSAVLLIALVVIFFYWRSSRAAADSARWLRFNNTDTDKGLDDGITDSNNQGKPVVAYYRLEKARLTLFREGIEKLGSYVPKDRETAVAKVEEGRKLYQELTSELNSSALQQEAWCSLAEAELVLLGTPKPDRKDEYLGSFNRAVDAYHKAAGINPDSEVSKGYAKMADNLKNKRTEMEAFYRRINQLSTPAPELPR